MACLLSSPTNCWVTGLPWASFLAHTASSWKTAFVLFCYYIFSSWPTISKHTASRFNFSCVSFWSDLFSLALFKAPVHSRIWPSWHLLSQVSVILFFFYLFLCNSSFYSRLNTNETTFTIITQISLIHLAPLLLTSPKVFPVISGCVRSESKGQESYHIPLPRPPPHKYPLLVDPTWHLDYSGLWLQVIESSLS